jgi:arginyl-tRNA synthetase
MIKYSRTKVIAFDIDEALSFEGESGPYLQYAVVRANNIFQKLQDREGVTEAQSCWPTLASTPPDALDGADGDHELWALVLEASRLDDIVEQVVRTLEFSVLAKYGSAWRRCSTPSTTRRPSSTRSARMCGDGARPRWRTSASSSRVCST